MNKLKIFLFSYFVIVGLIVSFQIVSADTDLTCGPDPVRSSAECYFRCNGEPGAEIKFRTITGSTIASGRINSAGKYWFSTSGVANGEYIISQSGNQYKEVKNFTIISTASSCFVNYNFYALPQNDYHPENSPAFYAGDDLNKSVTIVVDGISNTYTTPASVYIPANRTITVSAPGASFVDYWGNSFVYGSSASFTLTRNNVRIAAYFPSQKTLKVNVAPTPSGTVALWQWKSSGPTLIKEKITDVVNSYTGLFSINSSFDLTASRVSNFVFNNWSGSLTGVASTVSISALDSDKDVTANFKKVHSLGIVVSPANSGSVRATYTGGTQDMGNSQTVYFNEGTAITLTSLPTSAYNFNHWEISKNGQVVYVSYANSLSTTMDSDKTVTANFLLPKVTVDLKDPENKNIQQGSFVGMSWKTQNAQSCMATSKPALSYWSGSKDHHNGDAYVAETPHQMINADTGNYTLTLTCSGVAGDQASDSINITVVPETPVVTPKIKCSFWANQKNPTTAWVEWDCNPEQGSINVYPTSIMLKREKLAGNENPQWGPYEVYNPDSFTFRGRYSDGRNLTVNTSGDTTFVLTASAPGYDTQTYTKTFTNPIISCGDGTCTSGLETYSSCPTDCPPPAPFCGDTSCNGSENWSTCSADCPAAHGDGFCNASETCATYPGDCGVCPPTCSEFQASQTSIPRYSSVNLTWSCSNANSCIVKDESGTIVCSGSSSQSGTGCTVTPDPNKASTTYSITCNGTTITTTVKVNISNINPCEINPNQEGCQ